LRHLENLGILHLTTIGSQGAHVSCQISRHRRQLTIGRQQRRDERRECASQSAIRPGRPEILAQIRRGSRYRVGRTVRLSDTTTPQHLDTQLDSPWVQSRIMQDVQLGIRLEDGITCVGNVAARLRLGDISRRTGEVRAGGVGGCRVWKTSDRTDSVMMAASIASNTHSIFSNFRN
jgi:hypothetical protein